MLKISFASSSNFIGQFPIWLGWHFQWKKWFEDNAVFVFGANFLCVNINWSGLNCAVYMLFLIHSMFVRRFSSSIYLLIFAQSCDNNRYTCSKNEKRNISILCMRKSFQERRISSFWYELELMCCEISISLFIFSFVAFSSSYYLLARLSCFVFFNR